MLPTSLAGHVYAPTSESDVLPAAAAEISLPENADHDQRHSDHKVENVVNRRPFKNALEEQSEIARHGLINADEAEADGKGFDRRRVIAHNDDSADHPEDYVEDVVGSGAAGRTFMGGDNESEKPDEGQRRGKY